MWYKSEVMNFCFRGRRSPFFSDQHLQNEKIRAQNQLSLQLKFVFSSSQVWEISSWFSLYFRTYVFYSRRRMFTKLLTFWTQFAKTGKISFLREKNQIFMSSGFECWLHILDPFWNFHKNVFKGVSRFLKKATQLGYIRISRASGI